MLASIYYYMCLDLAFGLPRVFANVTTLSSVFNPGDPLFSCFVYFPAHVYLFPSFKQVGVAAIVDFFNKNLSNFHAYFSIGYTVTRAKIITKLLAIMGYLLRQKVLHVLSMYAYKARQHYGRLSLLHTVTQSIEIPPLCLSRCIYSEHGAFYCDRDFAFVANLKK